MDTKKEKDTLQTFEEEVESVENPLANMPPKMQRFLHLYMTGQYSINKLAQLLELHPNTLHNWMRRKEVKNAITEMQGVTHDVVSNQMKAMTLKAMERMRELMDSPIDGVALQAVKDVLDRAGHKPKNEIKVDKTVTTVEQKMKELIESTVIDAEFEEIE